MARFRRPPETGRAPLKRLLSVRRPSFECFSERGAAAQVLLGDKPYQVKRHGQRARLQTDDRGGARRRAQLPSRGV